MLDPCCCFCCCCWQVVGERYPDMKKFSYHYNKPLSAADL
jgi:hypothetical protein